MKPLNALKSKKLTLKKETLRTLTNGDLARVNGAAIASQYCGGTSWCSTVDAGKCAVNNFSAYCKDL